MKYRPEIDGLRALAVLPVIFFHAGLIGFKGGYVGVDVFFVISGYLITTLIIKDIDKGKFSLIAFYERRARRILPILFFIMAVCLPFSWFWLTPNELIDFGQSLVTVSTFTSNILFWRESGYFDTSAELKPLLHTWSLAIEEQFYILFPVFIMMIWRLGIFWILVTLFILFFSSLGISLWGSIYKPSAAYFLLPTRGWEIMIGVFIAFYLKYFGYLKSQIANQSISILGFALIIFSIIRFSDETLFPSPSALIPTLGTLFLILSTVPGTIMHNLLTYKYLVGLGLISYSAYLWHYPLFAFAKVRSFNDLTDQLTIVLIFTTFLLSYFTWKYVEQKYRDRKRVGKKQIFLLSIFGIIAFSTIGTAKILSNGFIIFYGADNYKLHSNFINSSAYLTDRFLGLQLKDFSDSEEKKKILIIGDSYAEDLTNSLYEAKLDSSLEISGYLIPAYCGVLYIDESRLKEETPPSCRNNQSFANEDLKNLISLADEVWLASIWPEFTLPYIYESVKNLKLINPNITLFGGKYFGEISSKYYKFSDQSKWKNPLHMTSIKEFQMLAQKNSYIESKTILAGGNFINSQEIICDGSSYCSNFYDFNIISYDGKHLTPYGAKIFGNNLVSSQKIPKGD